ncbi:MAG: manganese efflux pump MntP family protein [Erysipelotrichales bacterium]|nr:manganese efflux pump MntP family protein [Erysipelotrichales bacterium]
MNFFELFLIALALSMDAFAVSIIKGMELIKVNPLKALLVGVYFGLFQGVMPLIGFFLARSFADYVDFGPWIAFVLLSFLGIKMIISSFKKEECSVEKSIDLLSEAENKDSICLSPLNMLPLAIATSIDAMAVGVTLAFLQVQIVPAVSFIGVVTLVMAFFGVYIGSLCGAKIKSKAEIFGGIILILIGVKIIIEHLLQ